MNEQLITEEKFLNLIAFDPTKFTILEKKEADKYQGLPRSQNNMFKQLHHKGILAFGKGFYVVNKEWMKESEHLIPIDDISKPKMTVVKDLPKIEDEQVLNTDLVSTDIEDVKTDFYCITFEEAGNTKCDAPCDYCISSSVKKKPVLVEVEVFKDKVELEEITFDLNLKIKGFLEISNGLWKRNDEKRHLSNNSESEIITYEEIEAIDKFEYDDLIRRTFNKKEEDKIVESAEVIEPTGPVEIVETIEPAEPVKKAKKANKAKDAKKNKIEEPEIKDVPVIASNPIIVPKASKDVIEYFNKITEFIEMFEAAKKAFYAVATIEEAIKSDKTNKEILTIIKNAIDENNR
jgi:hypothetical protein